MYMSLDEKLRHFKGNFEAEHLFYELFNEIHKYILFNI